MSLEKVEKQHLIKSIRNSDLSAELLADKLGIGVRTFYRKLQKYGINIK